MSVPNIDVFKACSHGWPALYLKYADHIVPHTLLGTPGNDAGGQRGLRINYTLNTAVYFHTDLVSLETNPTLDFFLN